MNLIFYKYLKLLRYFFLLTHVYMYANKALKFQLYTQNIFKKNILKKISLIYTKIFINTIKTNCLAIITKKNYNLLLVGNIYLILKNNFLTLNNYLYLLLTNSINFLVLDFSYNYTQKLIYYSLIFNYIDLLKFKWFFNLDEIFLYQSKWQVLSRFLLKKYNIGYLLVLDYTYLQKNKLISLPITTIKILVISFLKDLKNFEMLVIISNKKLITDLLLFYLFQISRIILILKRIRNLQIFFNKNILLLQK